MYVSREQEQLSQLSHESQKVLEPYFAWARQGRDKFNNDFDFESKNFKSSRLLNSTYSSFEVDQLLTDHAQVLYLTASKEQEYVCASTGELMKELLLGMDRYQVPPSLPAPAMTILGNRAILAVEMADTKTLKTQRTLAPLTALDRGDETARQLVIANEEKKKLQDKVKLLMQQLSDLMRERSSHTETVAALNDTRGQLESQLSMTAQMSHEQLHQVLMEKDTLIRDRDARIAQLGSEISMLNRDMAGKLSQSSQFQNLKAMMSDRNAEVNRLRSCLRRYDPAAAGMDDEGTIIEEDD